MRVKKQQPRLIKIKTMKQVEASNFYKSLIKGGFLMKFSKDIGRKLAFKI